MLTQMVESNTETKQNFNEVITVEDYYRELRIVSLVLLSKASHSNDIQSEMKIQELITSGQVCYFRWRKERIGDQVCIIRMHEILINLWYIKVNGQVMSEIHYGPASTIEWTMYIRYYGRDEALIRLGLPSVHTRW